MSANPPSLFLSTNGAATSRPALDYGIWLASIIQAPVTLLGIVEKASERKAVETQIAEAIASLEQSRIPYTQQITKGQARLTICAHARPEEHLTVIGPLDRPWLKRWLQGRSFRRIQRDIRTPLLYAKEKHPHMREILVCMGGLGYASNAEKWAIYLARKFAANLTILHVVEPISYDYPTAQTVQEHWEDILTTDTPQGENLRRGLQEAQTAGINTTFKSRHGDSVHEIQTELGQNNYDLIVMGSPNSSNSLRHLYMPNVTAEIAESAPCPVLTVEFGQKLIFE